MKKLTKMEKMQMKSAEIAKAMGEKGRAAFEEKYMKLFELQDPGVSERKQARNFEKELKILKALDNNELALGFSVAEMGMIESAFTIEGAQARGKGADDVEIIIMVELFWQSLGVKTGIFKQMTDRKMIEGTRADFGLRPHQSLDSYFAEQKQANVARTSGTLNTNNSTVSVNC